VFIIDEVQQTFSNSNFWLDFIKALSGGRSGAQVCHLPPMEARRPIPRTTPPTQRRYILVSINVWVSRHLALSTPKSLDSFTTKRSLQMS